MLNLLSLLQSHTSGNKTSRKEILAHEDFKHMTERELRIAIHNIRESEAVGILGGFYTPRTLAEVEQELANSRAVIESHERTQKPLKELRDRLLAEKRREYKAEQQRLSI